MGDVVDDGDEADETSESLSRLHHQRRRERHHCQLQQRGTYHHQQHQLIMDRININRWLRATLAVAHKGELDGDARHVKPYRPQRLRHGPHQDQRYGCARYLQRATLAVAHAGEVDEAVVDG